MTRGELIKLYIQDRLSMQQIATKLNCSVHKVQYWMDIHKIPRRSISDAVYTKNNPNGDPYTLKPIKTVEDAWLLGMGIGLHWGEGNKVNKHSVRLGNTDPELLNVYVRFLVDLCGVDKSKLKFGLQIFSDTEPVKARKFWEKELGVLESQFYKVTVTPSKAKGTYRRKNQYGVVTVYFHNRKLRDIIIAKCRLSSGVVAHSW